MFDIKLEVSEYISTYKALEYLGLGWKPYTDNDERLLNDKREETRIPFNDKRPSVLSTAQSEYFNQMHNALVTLQYLIRNQKIKLYTKYVDHIEWTDEPFSEDDMLSEKDITIINKEKPASVYIEFGNLDEEPFIRSHTNIYINETGGFDYCIIVENKYGTFFYHDCPKIIKFSEIEPYYKGNSNKEANKEDFSESGVTSNYTTPYMEIMFETIKENNLSKDNQGNVESLRLCIQDKMRKKNLPESDKLVSSMATIIRLPEAQTGSAYHSRKRAKTKK